MDENVKLHPSTYQVFEEAKWLIWPSADLTVTREQLSRMLGSRYALVGNPEKGITLKFYQVKIGNLYWNSKDGWTDDERS